MKINFIAKLKIKVKFILSIVLLLFLAMSTLSIILIRQSEQLLVASKEKSVRLINENLSMMSAQGIQENSFSNLQALINRIVGGISEIKVLVVAYPTRIIIATSDKGNYPQFGKIDNNLVITQLRNKENSIIRHHEKYLIESVHFVYESTDNDDEENTGTNKAVNGKGELLGLIYIALDTTQDEKAIYDMRVFTIILTLSLTCLGIAAAYWVGSTMSNPIKSLAEQVRIIASGNLDNSITSVGRDEIAHLVKDVDKMRLSIKDLTENLEAKVKDRTEQLERANEEIIALNQKLKVENLRMSAELDITKQLQQMVLPRKEEIEQINGLDIAGFMEPADEVGGDYYDVLPYNGNQLKIGIGDVTGHGLESGVFMLMVQTAVRTLLTTGITDPIEFLRILNRSIYDNLQRMNVTKTMSLALLDYENDSIKVSGFHEEVVVVRKNGHVEHLETKGMWLAMEPDIMPYLYDSEMKISINPGDGIVLYSDGITEARPEGSEPDPENLYGLERLCNVISANWQQSARNIKQAVINDIRSYIGEKSKLYDDITLVVIKKL